MEAQHKIWLEKYPSIQKFERLVERGRISETTMRNYINDVRAFTKFLGFNNPEETLKYIKTIKQKEEWFDDLVGKLTKKFGDTRASITMKGVKRWVDLNKIDVDWRDVLLPSIIRKVQDRAPTKEELRRILSVSNIRDKAIVLVSVSSGLRANVIRTLTFGDVNFDYPDVAKITVKREYYVNGQLRTTGRKITKTKKSFITFITPEAKNALLDYKKYREEEGEQMTNESPLFTSQTKRNKGKCLNRVYFSVHWGRLLKRAHMDKKSEGWNVLHFHVLRKFFSTALVNGGVERSYSESWLGHKGVYLDESYFRAQEKEHVEQYRKAIEHLTILETTSTLTSQKVKDIIKKELETTPSFDKAVEKVANRLGVGKGEVFTKILAKVEETTKKEEYIPKTMFTAKKTRKETEDQDGDCTKIVEEKNLEEYFKKGFHFVSVLPSGKVLISND